MYIEKMENLILIEFLQHAVVNIRHDPLFIQAVSAG